VPSYIGVINVSTTRATQQRNERQLNDIIIIHTSGSRSRAEAAYIASPAKEKVEKTRVRVLKLAY
jgi:hypothetical protein